MVKILPANAEDTKEMGLNPGWKDPQEWKMETHSSILVCPMDRWAWWATVHGATKNWTRLSD